MAPMPEDSLRFRSPLARAAKWKMTAAVLAGGGLAYGVLVDPYLGFPQGAPAGVVCAQSAVLGLSIAIVFAWSLRSLAEARAGEGPLTAMAAHRLWGRAAGGDAVGLLPWGVLVCASFHRFGPSLPTWAIPVLAGLVLCLVVHLVLLPRLLERDLEGWTPTEVESSYGAPASDGVRRALARVAAWRLLGALVGLGALALPWVHGEALPNMGPLAEHVTIPGSGPFAGWHLLAGQGTRAASVFAWLHLAGLLVLLSVSWWEMRRSRWPLAVRLLGGRVFGAWAVSLVPTLPALVLWIGSLAMFAQARPFLAGAWLSLAGMTISTCATIVLPPLLLRRAVRRRIEACHAGDGVARDGTTDPPSQGA